MESLIAPTLHYKDKDQVWTIYPIGDIHLGASNTNEEKLQEDVERVASDPYSVWIGLGDYLDLILPKDLKRFHAKTLAEWINFDDLDNLVYHQVEYAAQLLAPIADKCLGLISGNHESSIIKYHSVDPVYVLAKELKYISGKTIPCLGKCAFIRQKFKHKDDKSGKKLNRLDISLHHGWFAGRKPGGKANNLLAAFEKFDCDLFICGHGHEKLVVNNTCLHVDEDGHIKDKHRFAMMTGSYLRTFTEGKSSYAEDAGYSPSTLGPVEIKYTPKTGLIQVIQ